jgi:serine/threonine protein kinase
MGDPSSPLFQPVEPGGDPFDLVGDVIDGQFRVDAVAGEGDLSIVYRGTHLGVDAPIAIKCLNLPATLDAKLVEPFVSSFREGARIHYQLARGHLDIAQSIACGTTLAPRTGSVVPYLAREWLDGRSLEAELASDKKKRKIEEVVALLASAADALAYAHDEGVPHHGLNPRNLFVAETPRGRVVKLLDFGVARALHEQSQMCAFPQAALRTLLPAYAAPEQLDRRFGEPGLATDVYTFALLVSETLVGEPVIPANAVVSDVLRMLRLDPRLRARWVGVSLGREVQKVLTRALALAPEERPASLRVLWDELTRAAKEQKKPPPLPKRKVQPPPLPTEVGNDRPTLEMKVHVEPPRAAAPSTPSITAEVAPPLAADVAAPLHEDRPSDDLAEVLPLRGPQRVPPSVLAGAGALAAVIAVVAVVGSSAPPERVSRDLRLAAMRDTKTQITDFSVRGAPPRFDRAAAQRALDASADRVGACALPGGPHGPGSVRVIFDPPTGRVLRISIGPPYRGTKVGHCVLDEYKKTEVGPFLGNPGAINYVFTSIGF